ncbi:MAG TPA: RNA-binding S4 domain-containing protein [Alphaproteobacteria bacterium]|nr:RNA-binding S4 domain-containing protein [Alphaproteobacteria bacterium]
MVTEPIKQENEKYIELNTFLKINNLAPTGGQAKNIIRDGEVQVNGTVETRNKKKLRDGDVVVYEGKKYIVKI